MLPGAASTQDGAIGTGERLDGLVRDHFDFIWRLLRRLGLPHQDADDAVQHVFMIATQKLDRITCGRERTFLYGTAIRVAANMRRTAHRRKDVAIVHVEAMSSPALQPDELADLGRARALLDELLAKLPPELARVIILAEIEQLHVAEIAELEGIPAGTAASRLRRARTAFQDLVREFQRGGS